MDMPKEDFAGKLQKHFLQFFKSFLLVRRRTTRCVGINYWTKDPRPLLLVWAVPRHC